MLSIDLKMKKIYFTGCTMSLSSITLTFLTITISAVVSQTLYLNEFEYRCPKGWVSFQDSCYRFIKSSRSRDDAQNNCRAYESHLLSINSLDEHGHILRELVQQDPQHRKWFTGVRMQGGYASNDDGTQLVNMENAFLPERFEDRYEDKYGRDALVYAYSPQLHRWGFEWVNPQDHHYYVCEAPASNLQYLLIDNDRTYQYGIEIQDPLKIPRGPYFVKQPVKTVFDIMKRSEDNNDVSLSCLASGYPAPTYEWFKEDFVNDRVIPHKIDPLGNSRYTISGGTLIIFAPNQVNFYIHIF